ncbi:hypothetical protein M3Y94_00840200 [Aphelenchoides besseyi]|nr:hypothetical protein M3Y94_00840200 [Aphelenchoides besseyi]
MEMSHDINMPVELLKTFGHDPSWLTMMLFGFISSLAVITISAVNCKTKKVEKKDAQGGATAQGNAKVSGSNAHPQAAAAAQVDKNTGAAAAAGPIEQADGQYEDVTVG